MADSKYSEEIKFYKPKLRFIIPISNFHYPKKLFSEFKKTKYSFKIDQNFAKVIAEECNNWVGHQKQRQNIENH